jgi:heme-degrading monooxygenase HmoA
MSVVVIGHFTVGDVATARQALASDAALLDEIAADAKGMGALHHRFLAGDREIVVLDEWESPQAFQRFFEGNAKVQRVTDAAGVQGPPRIEVYGLVEAAGTF